MKWTLINSLLTVCTKYVLSVDKLVNSGDVSHETVYNFVSHETKKTLIYIEYILNPLKSITYY